MLPDIFYTGGESMQDIKDEQNFLNGDTERDTTNLIATDPLKTDFHSTVIREDDTLNEFNEWPTKNLGSNLLKHSEDPLISSVVDDTQNDLNPICDSNSSIDMVPNTVQYSSLLTSQVQKKPQRNRRKAGFKLTFHHQALPSAYLDHYEATQNNLAAVPCAVGDPLKFKIFDKLDRKSNETVIASTSKQKSTDTKTNELVRDWVVKMSDNYLEKPPDAGSVVNQMPSNKLNEAKKTGPMNGKLVGYNDLPYMGEITLENSKPRRGRKPKKADICHLIYKNYGTVFPNTGIKPNETDDHQLPMMDHSGTSTKPSCPDPIWHKLNLCKRKHDVKSVLDNCDLSIDEKPSDGVKLFEEPLNLCMRDHGEILSSDDEDDTDTQTESNRTTPILTNPNDTMTDLFLADNLNSCIPSYHHSDVQINKMDKRTSPVTGGKLNNLICWPTEGIFIPPTATMLRQQRIISNANIKAEMNTTINQQSQQQQQQQPSNDKNESNELLHLIKTEDGGTSQIATTKYLTDLLNQDVKTLSPATVSSNSSSPAPVRPPSEASSTTSRSTSNGAPPKRKRSAIFIPPMPTEKTSSPATEVSICKFKFTGGAKPSLQEKKMLSVDSGGNFRYYSGTGDKSMRGYEFFPRESLQQSSLMGGSNSGVFLNTPGERIITDLPPSPHSLINETVSVNPSSVRNTMNSNPISVIMPSRSSVDGPQQKSSNVAQSSRMYHSSLDRRKRKSRRSIQREKLEKTFKEKGFLIQTQQLESAEGATYCKFRQLRKFTRYLFRSWKDYLPGDIQQQQQQLLQQQERQFNPNSHPVGLDPVELMRTNSILIGDDSKSPTINITRSNSIAESSSST